jgi:tetratricopeptide (TPR) repeat protein
MANRPRAAARHMAGGPGDRTAAPRWAGLAWILTASLACAWAGAPTAKGMEPQADESWLGVRVMARASGTKLKIGSEVTALLNAGSVFRTDRVRGDWLWVDSGSVRGWVKKDAVVPFDQAIVYFTDVIKHEPGNAHPLLCRGMARHVRRDDEGAIADETEALRCEPENPWAYHNRAAAHLARGEYEKALTDANAAVRLDPDEPAHRASRAGVHFERKAFDLAIADYSQAISKLKGVEADLDDSGDPIAPPPPSGRLCLVKWTSARGECWAAKHSLDKAIADFTTATRVDPSDSATLTSLSWLLATCSDSHYRDAKRALALALQACELTNYRDHLCLSTLAAACAEGGDYPTAIRWLTRAVALAAGDRRFTDNYLARLTLFFNKIPYHQEPTP